MTGPSPSPPSVSEGHFARLYRVSQAIHSTLEPREALHWVVREAVALVNAEGGSLTLLNPNTGLLEVEASEGLSPEEAALQLRPGEGIAGWVVQTGRVARVDDAAGDPRSLRRGEGAGSILAVPVRMEDAVRGVLEVRVGRPGAFSLDDEALLSELAELAAQVVRNTWRYQQHRQRAGLLEALVQLGRAINSSVHLDDVLQTATREAARLLSTRMSSLQLLDPSGEWLVLRAQHGAGSGYPRREPLSVAESLMGSVVRRRKPAQVDNVQTAPQYQHRALAREEGLVSLLSVPLVYGQQCLGTLNVYTGVPHVYSNDEVRALTALAELTAIAIEKARLIEHAMETEEQLRRNEQLAALGLLAAEVAHEIRNPLTAISVRLFTLQKNLKPGSSEHSDASLIRNEIDRLEQIVKNFLKLARPSEPKVAAIPTEPVLREVAALLGPQLQKRGVELKLGEFSIGSFLGDPLQIKQVLINLIQNAAESIDGRGAVTLRSRETAGAGGARAVVIEVEDTGSGISPDVEERLFDPFFSTKDSGTGLGLAIAAKIIEQHKGSLDFETRPGDGTVFRLTLPASSQ